jgi:hypothetical protein
MNDVLLESLLREEEGTSLDFKRDQYPFDGMPDEVKSELLKDILSFLNAWRRTDAYILIGVDEVKGGRSNIVGVSSHLDDAKLQQFVNSKTNRPVDFSYRPYSYEGKQIGVLHVPEQRRPTFLQKDFGRLRRHTVYIRRSSSTAEADPDEVQQMARVDQSDRPTPLLEFQFADVKARAILGRDLSLHSHVLDMPPVARIPDYGASRNSTGFMYVPDPLASHRNSDYWRELADFAQKIALFRPVSFVLTNHGAATARDVRIEIGGEGAAALQILLPDEFPARPSTSRFLGVRRQRGEDESRLRLWPHGDGWTLTVNAGKVRPRESWWSPEAVYLGAEQATNVQLEARIFSDDLPEPVVAALRVDVTTDHLKVDVKDLFDLREADD